MFGDLTAAFGLTVLCLAPIMLAALIVPVFLMRFTRPRSNTGEVQERGAVAAALVYARLYFMSLVVMVMLTIAFWWGFLMLTSDTNAVIDFASQSLPVERERVEEAVEPAATAEGS